MHSDNLGDTVRGVRHPILLILVSFPLACFPGALVTDVAYAVTANMMWADFSAWLLAVGLFMGVLAAIAGFVNVVANRPLRAHRQLWLVVAGSLLVLILGLLDNLVHSRDAWTSVVPTGLALSTVIVIVMLVTTWFGSAPLRYGAGARYPGAVQ